MSSRATAASATASASALTASGPSVPSTTAKSTVATLTGSEMNVTVDETPTSVRERLIAWCDGYRVAIMCYNRHTHAHLWRLCATIAT